jgi:hypothetical protein
MLLLLLTCSAAAMGCGDDDDPPWLSRGDDGRCASTPRCRIDEAACQHALLRMTACERSEDVPPPPLVRMISRAELAEEFRSELEGEPGSADMLQNGMPRSPSWDAALASMQLLPLAKSSLEASIDNKVDTLGAYYSLRDKRLTIIEDSVSASDELEAMFTLSHELTHYLQDQALDLNRLQEESEPNLDSRTALVALIEGDATITGLRVVARVEGAAPRDIAWDQFLSSLDESAIDLIDGSDAPLTAAASALPYPVGSRYVSSAWNDRDEFAMSWFGSRARVDALFERPPASLIDLLDGYHGDAPTTSLREPLACAPPDAPEDFVVAAAESMGATGVVALLAAAGTPDLTLAARVRGDRIALYTLAEPSSAEDPSQPPSLIAWRLRFDSEQSAQEFLQRVRPLGLEQRAFEREVLITASAGLADNPLRGDTLESCPELEKFAVPERGGSMMMMPSNARR